MGKIRVEKNKMPLPGKKQSAKDYFYLEKEAEGVHEPQPEKNS